MTLCVFRRLRVDDDDNNNNNDNQTIQIHDFYEDQDDAYQEIRQKYAWCKRS